MLGDVKVELTPGLESKLKAFPVVAASTTELAEKIRDRAVQITEEEGHVLTGRYRDGIITDSANAKSRGVARVRATDQKSSWMEFGNYKHDGFFILRKAAISLGLSFTSKK